MEKVLGKCIRFFKEEYSRDLSVYDHDFFRKTLEGRINSTSCKSAQEYNSYLLDTPAEHEILIRQMSNSYSEFFRNGLTFSFLEQAIIPKLFEKHNRKASGDIRIWSAGCASGQEPYSLAMLFEDYKASRQTKSTYRFFATDNSSDQIEAAKMGIFSSDNIKNVKFKFINEFFSKIGDKYAVNDKIKSRIDFSVFNLLDEVSSAPPASVYGDFDLVMCSNVLFYYKSSYQKFIIEKLNRVLKPGGIFITSEAEVHLFDSASGFTRFASPAPIFIKN